MPRLATIAVIVISETSPLARPICCAGEQARRQQPVGVAEQRGEDDREHDPRPSCGAASCGERGASSSARALDGGTGDHRAPLPRGGRGEVAIRAARSPFRPALEWARTTARTAIASASPKQARVGQPRRRRWAMRCVAWAVPRSPALRPVATAVDDAATASKPRASAHAGRAEAEVRRAQEDAGEDRRGDARGQHGERAVGERHRRPEERVPRRAREEEDAAPRRGGRAAARTRVPARRAR